MDNKSGDSDSAAMSPKNNQDPSENTSSGNVDDTDLQEIEAVNESLDELSSVLDNFEQKTDNIIKQLLELLHSNREIRQELAKETAVHNMDLEESNT